MSQCQQSILGGWSADSRRSVKLWMEHGKECLDPVLDIPHQGSSDGLLSSHPTIAKFHHEWLYIYILCYTSYQSIGGWWSWWSSVFMEILPMFWSWHGCKHNSYTYLHRHTNSQSLVDMLLVGGFNPPEKYYSSQIGSSSQLLGKVIRFHGSKPPTRSPSYSHCCWFIAY